MVIIKRINLDKIMKKTKEQISKNMRSVKSKDTKIEILLRKRLWKEGLRYRKNVQSIEGRPDIVFLGKKVAIFCDSSFWHGKNWESKKYEIKSNQEFWYKKIERNIERDNEVNELLQSKGWVVLRFSDDEITKQIDVCVEIIKKVVKQ